MSVLIDKYAEAQNSFAVKYRNFLLWSSKRKDHLLCAVEGQDDVYYDSRVRTIIPELESSFFHMGGRTNVLELLELAPKNAVLCSLKLAFFVDHDYCKPNVYSDLLYVTPGYSIENHYVSRAALRRILRTAFDMRELVKQGSAYVENEQLNRLLDFCCQVIDTYVGTLGIQLNAFLLAAYTAARERGEVRHSVRTKAFDHDRFLLLFEIAESGFVPKTALTFESLLKEYNSKSEHVSAEHFADSFEKLRSLDPIKFGRGKFLFAVLMSVLDFLRSDGRRTKPRIFSCKQPCKLELSELPLATLSVFADTPQELTAFLRKLRTTLGIDSTGESAGRFADVSA